MFKATLWKTGESFEQHIQFIKIWTFRLLNIQKKNLLCFKFDDKIPTQL